MTALLAIFVSLETLAAPLVKASACGFTIDLFLGMTMISTVYRSTAPGLF